jgi:hypothetical protein
VSVEFDAMTKEQKLGMLDRVQQYNTEGQQELDRLRGLQDELGRVDGNWAELPDDVRLQYAGEYGVDEAELEADLLKASQLESKIIKFQAVDEEIISSAEAVSKWNFVRHMSLSLGSRLTRELDRGGGRHPRGDCEYTPHGACQHG